MSAVVVTGTTSLAKAGQTVQLAATASFSDGTTQNVTVTATWQSSNAAVATVSAGGLVTAVAVGTVTITAAYQGKTGTATLPISFTTSSGSTLTATVDATPFNAIIVSTAKYAIPGLASGGVTLGGTSSFTVPFSILGLSVPAAVGTYQLGQLSSSGQLSTATASLQLDTIAGAMEWTADPFEGSGTITVTTFTSTRASGTFSLNLVPLVGTGTTGNKLVTNGEFNVTF